MVDAEASAKVVRTASHDLRPLRHLKGAHARSGAMTSSLPLLPPAGARVWNPFYAEQPRMLRGPHLGTTLAMAKGERRESGIGTWGRRGVTPGRERREKGRPRLCRVRVCRQLVTRSTTVRVHRRKRFPSAAKGGFDFLLVVYLAVGCLVCFDRGSSGRLGWRLGPARRSLRGLSPAAATREGRANRLPAPHVAQRRPRRRG